MDLNPNFNIELAHAIEKQTLYTERDELAEKIQELMDELGIPVYVISNYEEKTDN